MAEWHDGTIESNGVKLHYTRTGGDKAPIVLAHGLTDNGLAWTKLARALEHYYDLILVDARGHGLSDKPEKGYSPEDHMRDMAGLIQALGLEKPVIVGHSMGAITASLVASEYPELVRATVLEDPVWRWPTSPKKSVADKQQLYEGWKSRLAYRKTLSVEESFIRGRRERPLWSAEDHDSDVPAKHQVALQALDFIVEHESRWMEQVVKFQSPVLLVYGNTNLGGIVGPDIAAEARRLNGLVEPVQIPTAGHSIRREQFEDYLAVVREFLARIQRIQPIQQEAVFS